MTLTRQSISQALTLNHGRVALLDTAATFNASVLIQALLTVLWRF